MKPKALVYRVEMQTRYSDLDVYGHINGVRMLQMVMDSRHIFYAEKFKRTALDALKEGFAVYTTKLSTTFRKSVMPDQKIVISSAVKNIIGPVLQIHFDVLNPDTEEVYCSGQFEQVAVDPVKQVALDSLPTSARKYFFEESPA